jgi:hypothetical protein
VISRAAKQAGDRDCAIVLDEAHVIAEWPADAQETLNVALRDSGSLGVIVASSERRAMELLLQDGQPLYSAGYSMSLPEIDTATWEAGLEERFAELGATVDPNALRELVRLAHHHPYCTMRLAAESALQAEQERSIKSDKQPVIDELSIQAALVVVRDDPVWKKVIG